MKWISTVLLSVLFLSGCAQRSLLQEIRVENPDHGSPATSKYTPSDFENAIAKLESEKLGTGPEARQAYLDLSYLYSHHANPSPDYAKALASLEIYLYLSDGKTRPAHVQNRLDLFRKLNSLLSARAEDARLIKLLREDNRVLMLEIQKLKDSVAALQNENLAMKQLMERLNQLEMQHEEKRKQVK